MTQATSAYHIERLSLDNIHHLKFLFKKVFNKKVTLDYLLGMYDTQYLGKTFFGHLAFDKQKPIAFHGCVVYQVQYNGKLELGAQYGNAMTLKEYTGQGLFTILGKRTDELLKSEGVNFAYGFPNQNSEYGYLNKMDWQYEYRMVGFKIPVSSFPYEKVLRLCGLKNWYQKIVGKLLKNYECPKELKHSFDDGAHASVLRDGAFYNYKKYTPNRMLELDGTKVWVKADEAFSVGAIGTKNEEQFIGVVEKIKKLAAKLGLRNVVLQYHPKSEEASFLRKKYKSFDSWVIGYLPYETEIDLTQLYHDYGDLDTF